MSRVAIIITEEGREALLQTEVSFFKWHLNHFTISYIMSK